MIRWIDSGIYEVLEMRFKKVVARGPATPPHFIVNTGMPFRCEVVNPKACVPAGELLYPWKPAPGIVYEQSKAYHLKVEAHIRKNRERIVRNIMEC